jgi:hypothetical protein
MLIQRLKMADKWTTSKEIDTILKESLKNWHSHTKLPGHRGGAG